jgi:RNA polymerase sigma-70 factor (ECF subfamily)
MLGSVQDAEDAVQETLLAVWRSLDSFEERATLRTWLYRIATRRCLNALILRDVLGFHVSEAARILDATPQSAASALKRARATLARQLPSARERAAPSQGSVAEQRLAARFANAFEAGDVDAVVALLTHDAWLTMPPVPLEYQGRELADRFLTLCFRGNRRGRRLIATRANGQPAFGVYQRDPHAALMRANGLMVLTLADNKICAITRFDNSVLARFGLPRSLPA